MTDGTRKWLAWKAKQARRDADDQRAMVRLHPVNPAVDAAAIATAEVLEQRAADLEELLAKEKP